MSRKFQTWGRRFWFNGKYCWDAFVNEAAKEVELLFDKLTSKTLTLEQKYDTATLVKKDKLQREHCKMTKTHEWSFSKIEFLSIGQDSEKFIVKFRCDEITTTFAIGESGC